MVFKVLFKSCSCRIRLPRPLSRALRSDKGSFWTTTSHPLSFRNSLIRFFSHLSQGLLILTSIQNQRNHRDQVSEHKYSKLYWNYYWIRNEGRGGLGPATGSGCLLPWLRTLIGIASLHSGANEYLWGQSGVWAQLMDHGACYLDWEP